MISKYEDIKKAGEYLQEHTRKYHLELNRGFNKFKAPLGISLVVSIIAMLISVIIYSNRYKIAPEILWDKNYFNLALICIVYIFSFTSIIILMINAGDYLRSLNLIQYLKSKEFVLSLRIKKSLVFYVKIILLCTTMSLHSKSRVNRFIKTILGIITFIIKLPKIYVFAVPFLYTLFFWLILHGQPENALLLLQLWAIIGIFSIFSSDETRSYIFVCLSVNYFVFLYWSLNLLLMLNNVDENFSPLNAFAFAPFLAYMVFFVRPLEYSSPIEQRSRQSVVMCVILSIVAPQAFESLMSFTYTGGGLPIVISHQKQPETHKALLVMDRKDDFIAFDTETQSSKIYEKSDIFWQLEKAALNSKNNNATIVSNKET